MDEREFSLAVVGIDFPNDDKAKSNRRFEAQLLAPGASVELRREPRNKHDPRAVAVFNGQGVQLGYLRAEQAQWIGGKILAGEIYEAVFQRLDPTAAIIRVKFGGGAPTLPADDAPRARPAERWDDDGFEADPEPGMWGA